MLPVGYCLVRGLLSEMVLPPPYMGPPWHHFSDPFCIYQLGFNALLIISLLTDYKTNVSLMDFLDFTGQLIIETLFYYKAGMHTTIHGVYSTTYCN